MTQNKVEEDQKWQTVRRTTNASGNLVSETKKPQPTLKPKKIKGAQTTKFITTVYDREGKADRQFVRTEPALVAREALWETISAGLRDSLPRVEPTPAPILGDGADLLTA